MKVRITEENILRRITPYKVLTLLEKEDLYNECKKEIKNTNQNKIKVIKKYVRLLSNITFLNHNLYGWSKK